MVGSSRKLVQSAASKLRVLPLAVLAILASLLIATPVLADEGTSDPASDGGIRVGFFDFSGFQEQDENGNRSGYSYDFLEKLQSYLDEPFEYLDYDVSFSDTLDLLAEGEVDLVATITKTPEREQVFLFSDEPIGTEATNLTTKAGNEEIVPGDYATYDGMVVGVLDDNSANAKLARLAEEKGFSYEPFTFETEDELIQALDDGLVDAILTSSIRATDGEWLVETFEPDELYVVTNRENAELMDRVNEAIAAMDVTDSNWRDELAAKHKTIGATVSLDASERAYLQSLAESGETLSVLLSPGHEPYSTFTEEGLPDGIFPALFEVIAAKIGLPYTYLEPADNAEYESMIFDGTADIVLDLPDEPEIAEAYGLTLTDPYVTTGFAQVVRRGFTGNAETIGVVQGDSDELVDYLDATYPPDALRFYPNSDAAAEAVRSGEVDAVAAHAHSAERVVLDDPRQRLVYTLLDIPDEAYAMGVKASEPQELVELLNEGIESIDSSSYGTLIAMETAPQEIPMPLLVYLSMHPVWAAVFVISLQVAVGIVVFILTRAHYGHRRRPAPSRGVAADGDASQGDGSPLESP